MVEYVPTLKGSVWDDVTVGSVLNMTTGLDNEETAEAIMNPDSAVVRFFASGLIAAYKPRETLGTWVDVARAEKKIEGENQGDVFRYASINTQVLTQLIENVDNKKWTQVFEDRVWSKVYALVELPRKTVVFCRIRKTEGFLGIDEFLFCSSDSLTQLNLNRVE